MFIEELEKNKLKIIVQRIEETLVVGESIGKTAKKGEIIALNGNLGAGKTVLVKGIAKGLEISEEPNSPTFVILNTYEGKYPLYHFDFYRLNTESDLEDLNYTDFFYGEGVSVVEWAKRISEVFPENCIKIDIEITENTDNDTQSQKRIISITGEEEWLSLFKNTVEQALQT